MTKLYVLTGFLGAGKTTLLLHLLDGLADRKIGILQNEFGKLDVDSQLLERDGLTMTEIGRGSIFCSCLKLSFVKALAELGQKGLDYVFVESSGLADPSNIEEILAATAQLGGEVYDFCGVICLIDAIHFLEQLTDVETVHRQLAHCNLAVVNKVDAVDAETLQSVMAAVRRVNPVCNVVPCTHGALPLDCLGQDLTDLRWAPCEDSSNRVDNKPKTLSLHFDGVLPQTIFASFLQAVLPECYRIKGFFRLEEGWRQVDVVEDTIDYKPCAPREESQLVFLSKIGPNVIRTIDSSWKKTTHQPMQLKN